MRGHARRQIIEEDNFQFRGVRRFRTRIVNYAGDYEIARERCAYGR